MNKANQCCRCGNYTMEFLKTHSYCLECNYFPEEPLSYKSWFKYEYRNPKAINRNYKNLKELNLHWY